MTRLRISLAIFGLALTAPTALSAVTTTLTFDAPVPASLTDTNGLGTGFTTRLPLTGGALPVNDPNMDLLASPGKLLLTSTQADINGGGANLPNLEAPGIFIPGVGSSDLTVSAIFENVHLPNGSDQLEVYAGADAHTSIRAGLHEKQVYIMSPNNGGTDMNTFTPDNAFTAGDNIEVILSRQSGLWSLSWNNLTAATSGSLPGVSLPWLDANSDLYFGVLAANAGSSTSFVGQIDYFSVTVPEPGSIVLFVIGAVALLIVARRRLNS